MIFGATCDAPIITITSFQEWVQWWGTGGADNGCAVLWGIPLFWWSRIGKMVGFAGTFLVVAELINLQNLADKLSEVLVSFVREKVRQREFIIIILVVTSFFSIVVKAYITFREPSKFVRGLDPHEVEWHYFWQLLPIVITWFAVPIISVAVGTLIAGVIIPYLVLKPLVWVLEKLPGWAKGLNLFLATAGFICDFLSS